MNEGMKLLTYSEENLGVTSLVETPTVEVVEKPEWDFPVSTVNVQTDGGIHIPNRKAIIRTDTNQVLSIVSDGYRVLHHSTAVEIAENAIKNHLGTFEKQKTVVQNDGAKLYMVYDFPNITKEVAKGDIVNFRLTLLNSYDKSSIYGMILGAMRLVCLNGMTANEALYSFRRKHYGSGIESLDEKYFAPALGRFYRMAGRYQQMVETKMDVAPALERLEEELKFPKRILTDIVEKEHLDGEKVLSEWEVYNAFTHYMTHIYGKEMKNTPSHSRQLQLEEKIGKLLNV